MSYVISPIGLSPCIVPHHIKTKTEAIVARLYVNDAPVCTVISAVCIAVLVMLKLQWSVTLQTTVPWRRRRRCWFWKLMRRYWWRCVLSRPFLLDCVGWSDYGVLVVYLRFVATLMTTNWFKLNFHPFRKGGENKDKNVEKRPFAVSWCGFMAML